MLAILYEKGVDINNVISALTCQVFECLIQLFDAAMDNTFFWNFLCVMGTLDLRW